MLLSTQAATMPSVTISNYRPLTKAKLRYEAFVARMSESSNIATSTGTTAGHPQLAGLHLSIEPFPGWSLGVGRIMQYGGGDREDSFGDLLDAFFNPADNDNTGTPEDFGNQLASLTSQFVVGEPLPLAIYFEYAGEDTSTLSNFRLGNAALSAGIAFPQLGQQVRRDVRAHGVAERLVRAPHLRRRPAPRRPRARALGRRLAHARRRRRRAQRCSRA